jgi:hypothetical protein
VTSAFETVHDPSLALLGKGHTAADMAEALDLAADSGLDVHPTWMPFMPWTAPEHVVEIFRFVDRHGLFPVTDPVQLSIRLLVPPGSLLLDDIDHDGLDPSTLGYRWASRDPRSDMLQQVLSGIASRDAETDRDPTETLTEMWVAALEEVGGSADEAQIPAGATLGRPRMTEPWFC